MLLYFRTTLNIQRRKIMKVKAVLMALLITLSSVIPAFAGAADMKGNSLTSGTSAVVIAAPVEGNLDATGTGSILDVIARIIMTLKLYVATGDSDFLINTGPEDGVFLIKVAGSSGQQKPQTQKVVVQK